MLFVFVEETPAFDGLVSEDDEKGEHDGLDQASGQPLRHDPEALLLPQQLQRLREGGAVYLVREITQVITIVGRPGQAEYWAGLISYLLKDK